MTCFKLGLGKWMMRMRIDTKDEDNNKGTKLNIAYAKGGLRFPIVHALHSVLAPPKNLTQKLFPPQPNQIQLSYFTFIQTTTQSGPIAD